LVSTERTRESQKQPGQYSRKKKNNSEDKILSITNDFKRYKITDLTRPNELGTTTSKVATRSLERIRLWNDYMLLVTTRQKTHNSKTLFSSKERRSASKTDISGTAGQHKLGEARRRQST
jgi:hypothetical protein